MPQEVVKRRGSFSTRTVNGRRRKLTPLMAEKKEAAREKQNQALELRKAGATYNEIAQALGYYNSGGAKKAVDAAMARVVVESSKEIILLDLQRLDELQKRCMAQLRNKNDLSQVDRILRIMQQRYALAGIGEETARELREAMGITQQITQNNTQLVIQVNPNSEEAYVRKMMGAAGLSSETIEEYVDAKLKPKELTPGPPKQKKVVVRRRRKSSTGGSNSKGNNKGNSSTEEFSEETKVVGKLMGVDDSSTTMGDMLYKDSISTYKKEHDTFPSIKEDDIIDAEIIE